MLSCDIFQFINRLVFSFFLKWAKGMSVSDYLLTKDSQALLAIKLTYDPIDTKNIVNNFFYNKKGLAILIFVEQCFPITVPREAWQKPSVFNKVIIAPLSFEAFSYPKSQ